MSTAELEQARDKQTTAWIVAHLMQLVEDALREERERSASEIDRLQRENALMQERTADYPTISAKLHDREKAREAEQRDCREAIARAEAAEAEVKRLQTELALSKPLYSRRQIEARVKLLEAALKPFADLAECYDPDENDGDLKCWHDGSIPKIKDLRRARNALASTGGDHHAE